MTDRDLEDAISEIDKYRRKAEEAHAAIIAEREKLREDIAALREVLTDCADDLAVMLSNYYAASMEYPSQAKKYDRDMEPVLRARAVLDKIRMGQPSDLPSPAEAGFAKAGASAKEGTS